jgi:hypothetical protein
VTYLRKVAERIRAEVPPGYIPDADTTILFDVYAALALSRGTKTTRREVHDAWVVWMLAQGEHHPAMVPYDELPSATQAADEPFAQAIRKVAATLA